MHITYHSIYTWNYLWNSLKQVDSSPSATYFRTVTKIMLVGKPWYLQWLSEQTSSESLSANTNGNPARLCRQQKTRFRLKLFCALPMYTLSMSFCSFPNHITCGALCVTNAHTDTSNKNVILQYQLISTWYTQGSKSKVNMLHVVSVPVVRWILAGFLPILQPLPFNFSFGLRPSPGKSRIG